MNHIGNGKVTVHGPFGGHLDVNHNSGANIGHDGALGINGHGFGGGDASYTTKGGKKIQLVKVDVKQDHNVGLGAHKLMELQQLNGLSHVGNAQVTVHGPLGGHLDLTHNSQHGIGGNGNGGLGLNGDGSNTASYTTKGGKKIQLMKVDIHQNHNVGLGTQKKL